MLVPQIGAQLARRTAATTTMPNLRSHRMTRATTAPGSTHGKEVGRRAIGTSTTRLLAIPDHRNGVRLKETSSLLHSILRTLRTTPASDATYFGWAMTIYSWDGKTEKGIIYGPTLHRRTPRQDPLDHAAVPRGGLPAGLATARTARTTPREPPRTRTSRAVGRSDRGGN